MRKDSQNKLVTAATKMPDKLKDLPARIVLAVTPKGVNVEPSEVKKRRARNKSARASRKANR